MNWRDIRVLYWCELRSALRERTIVINSILVPIFLYPVLLWVVMSAMMFVSGRSEGLVSRITLVDLPAAHAGIRDKLAENDQLELVTSPEDIAEATEQVRAGTLEAMVEFLPASGQGASLAGNFEARLTFDGSKDRSSQARARLVEVLGDYRTEWMREAGESLGVDEAGWVQFHIDRNNVATEKQMGAFVMSLMLPLFLVIMVAVGCFHPAIDATAGERERGTWETLMTVAASRSSVVTAKYLYVASLGAVAGVLNVAAMTMSSKAIFAPMLSRAEKSFDFNLPPLAIPVMAVGAILIAMFAAAGMMILASFARTFKEGQSMVTPFYLLLFMPVILLQQPDTELTPLLAVIPVANVLMVVREAITGQFNWPLIGVAVVVEMLAVFLCLRFAAFILKFEDVLVGSYAGNLVKFLRERVRGGGKKR